MKFFGILYGAESIADSIFQTTEAEYNDLKKIASATKKRPSVIFDGLYGSQWYVPGKNSTAATYIRDAGGSNPFDRYDIAGSMPLSAEQMLHQAHDAAFWFVRYAQSQPLNLTDHLQQNKVYPQFEAAKNNNVFGCNTMEIPLFDETPFHPQWFLADIISIIHPELGISSQHQYFKRL